MSFWDELEETRASAENEGHAMGFKAGLRRAAELARKEGAHLRRQLTTGRERAESLEAFAARLDKLAEEP